MDQKTEKRLSVDGSIEKIDIEHASIAENKRFIASPAEKKLVKKINLAFGPLLCLILFIQVPYILTRDLIKHKLTVA